MKLAPAHACLCRSTQAAANRQPDPQSLELATAIYLDLRDNMTVDSRYFQSNQFTISVSLTVLGHFQGFFEQALNAGREVSTSWEACGLPFPFVYTIIRSWICELEAVRHQINKAEKPRKELRLELTQFSPQYWVPGLGSL
jgi:hypothetical protein